MIVLRVLLFLAGLALVLLMVRSMVRTFLVPRALQAHLSRAVFVLVRRVFRLRASERHDYAMRDRVMALYAPVSLLVLLAVWFSFLLLGYSAMFFALGEVSPSEAFTLAGSSMLTLGFAHPPTDAGVFLGVTAAGLGLVLLALFITYLPSLYGAFQRRERGVAKLEVRAGQPPTGVYLIELAWTVGRLENLRSLWAEWEDWFTDVDESHSSFPALVFFRSTHPDQSWITAAGAILDGASLFASTVDTPRQPEPEFMIRSGYLCLRHLAEFFNIPVDHDPQPGDPISITREEFDAAADRLQASGVPVRPDATSAGGTSRVGASTTTAPWSSWRSSRWRPSRPGRPIATTMSTSCRPRSPGSDGPASAGRLPAPYALGEAGTMTDATFVTSMGSFTVRLMPEHAPKTVANFVELAQGSKGWTDPRDGSHATDPLYAGTIFHRVIGNFMIQGGDPTGTGTGGPGYTFEDECPPAGPRFDRPGLLAMANAGPNSNGCQFFVTVAAADWLSGKHTIFGEVTDGYDVVEAISRTPTKGQDRPITDVVLERVDISD